MLLRRQFPIIINTPRLQEDDSKWQTVTKQEEEIKKEKERSQEKEKIKREKERDEIAGDIVRVGRGVRGDDIRVDWREVGIVWGRIDDTIIREIATITIRIDK